jgi:hypothetical protein
MGISIGITETRARAFTHYGEITELAAEMKKFAKQSPGSCFKSDRRIEEDINVKDPKKKKKGKSHSMTSPA